MTHDQEKRKNNGLGRALELVEAVDTFVSDFGPLMDAAGGVFQLWKATLQPVFRDLEPILERLSELMEVVGPHVEKLVRHQRIERKFSNSGWLPYYSELVGRVRANFCSAAILRKSMSCAISSRSVVWIGEGEEIHL